MARGLLLLVVLWLVAVGGFSLLRRVPKTSPLWALRDFFWLLLLASSSVLLLGLVALAAGLISLQNSPFVPEH
ncbi:MAG: hypothetical protein NZ849_01665 [Meiothermus sp.]|uniref:hypothetical protein n=1 Tax=Meiothermus sp. TaxID=1955249 RepID=UPI0025DA93BC|nr:hypothetical protein [Meiothermus sp.]MCS7057382.1 hypothetical protein [Meiothermus sp.]MCS7193613.1 hypothetical protein [Meiothermus sp.]MCX7741096.1 hypothetical protein [Meiothermus sp.]MDW8090627.1 hypothetical protein [Meiothermus sp.]MDW8480543.1 hypothetical protein [Meiothermus sp.]